MICPPLCAIIDTEAATRHGWPPFDLATAFMAGGARFLQLRAKSMASGAFLDLARAVVEAGRAAGAVVIINDRADIARISGADGVHVGQDDLTAADVRAVVGPHAIVGLSTHTVEQRNRALEEPISYVAIGPVFATATKDTGHDPVGLDGVADMARRAAARGLPVVAIGGVTLDRSASVIQ